MPRLMPRVLEIEGHLELRVLAPRHARRLHRLIAANRASLAAWLPWADGGVALRDVRRYIAEQHHLSVTGGGLAAGIWEAGELCGVVALHHIDWADLLAELGYWVDTHHRGAGLATRAAGRVAKHAFDSLGLHRLEIRCAAGNQASRTVAERLGFALEGTLRDARRLGDGFHDEVIYGLLAGEQGDRLAP